MQNLQDKNYIFELSVSGMRCTNCSQKIMKNLDNYLSVTSVGINILSEKVVVCLSNPEDIKKIVEKINQLHFQVVADPRRIDINSQENQRNIIFHVELENQVMNKIQNLKEVLSELPGMLNFSFITNSESIQIIIQYNQTVLRGIQLFQQISQQKFSKIYFQNPYIDSVKSQLILQNQQSDNNLINNLKNKTNPNINKRKSQSVNQVVTPSLAIFILILLNFILPLIFNNFYQKMLIFPFDSGIYSIYQLFMLIFCQIFGYKYGLIIFKKAYQNYVDYRQISMDTLITLGSLSSLALGYYLLIIYNLQDLSSQKMVDEKIRLLMEMEQTNGEMNEQDLRIDQIEMIIHMFMTSTLIVLIVTIGKFLESKAKRNIMKMTEEMFPEEELIQNCKVKHVELKNKQFAIERETLVDVTIIDKDDLILIEGPMLLLIDCTILNIEKPLKVIDAACYGQLEFQEIKEGDSIKSGAKIIKGRAVVLVTNTIEKSLLCQISQQLTIVQSNATSKSNSRSNIMYQHILNIFVKVILVISAIVFLIWSFLILLDKVEIHSFCRICKPIENAISVLVASCPCALGLAIPIIIVITLNLAMKNGILIKKNRVFEQIGKIKAIVFDKTGTLFTQIDHINDYIINKDLQIYDDNQYWQIIVLVEKNIKHPMADLLYREGIRNLKRSAAQKLALKKSSINNLLSGNDENDSPTLKKYKLQLNNQSTQILNSEFMLIDFPKTIRNGVCADVLYKTEKRQFNVMIGNMSLIEEQHIYISSELKEIIINKTDNQEQASLFLCIDKQINMILFYNNSENLRQECQTVLYYLQNRLKKDVFILSGDTKENVLKVAKLLSLPIENVFSQRSPEEKLQVLKELQAKYNQKVMMIGDGLNDILSMQESCVSVSINASSELNLLISDVAIINQNLWKIPFLFSMMKKANLFIYINLFWAAIYNLIVVPLAAGAFNVFGYQIAPTTSCFFMSCSSLAVALLANLLRCFNFNLNQDEIKELTLDMQIQQFKQTQLLQKCIQNNEPNNKIDLDDKQNMNKENEPTIQQQIEIKNIDNNNNQQPYLQLEIEQ